MNNNVAIQNVGTVAWDGTTSYPGDIRRFTRFAWSFETTADLTADAIFNVEAAPPSPADNCLPGTFEPVEEISICDVPAIPGPQATITIPDGTLAGTVCSGTIPCVPNAFVRLTALAGQTPTIRAVLIRQGPM
jgi:hypothetical protein